MLYLYRVQKVTSDSVRDIHCQNQVRKNELKISEKCKVSICDGVYYYNKVIKQ